MKDKQRPEAKPKLSPEEYQKIEPFFKAFKDTSKKYIDKFGEDDFIVAQFDEFKKVSKSIMNGDMKIDDSIKKLKEMEKKISEKL